MLWVYRLGTLLGGFWSCGNLSGRPSCMSDAPPQHGRVIRGQLRQWNIPSIKVPGSPHSSNLSPELVFPGHCHVTAMLCFRGLS